MGIFERRDDEEAEEEEGGADLKISPQGWFDRDEGWPPEAPSRYTYLFETPLAAAIHLDDAGRRLAPMTPRDGEPEEIHTERVHTLEAYVLALQALQLESPEIDGRKGAYGRVTDCLPRHLKGAPWLLHYRSSRALLEALVTELKDSDDNQLVEEGETVEAALAAAAEAVPEAPASLAGAATPGPRSRVRGGPPTAPERPAEAATPPPESEPELTSEAAAEASGTTPPTPSAEDGAAEGPGTPFEGGPELTAEKIFRVLLEECLKDGKISQAESRAIRQIRQLLQIDIERHKLLAEAVQADFQAGRVRGSEDMDPLTFFEKICRIALIDGVVTGNEQRLLQAIASYLHVTREEFQAIRQRIHENPGLAG